MSSTVGSSQVLLLRHAETAVPGHYHGSESDVGLSQRGKTEADQLAKKLALVRPQAIYCSGMRRARETARPIADAAQVERIEIPRLHERQMGKLSNQPIEIHRSTVEKVIARWKAGELTASHAGGESYLEMLERVVPIVQEIADAHRGQTIILVLHGMVIRVLLTSLVRGLSLADFDQISIGHLLVNHLQKRRPDWDAIKLGVDFLTDNASQASILRSLSPYPDNFNGES